jgi:hypothetical protein
LAAGSTARKDHERTRQPHRTALQRSLTDVIAEYDAKLAALPQAMTDFEAAGNALKMAATIGGTFGDVTIDTGHNYVDSSRPGPAALGLEARLRRPEHRALSSADDKRKWKQEIEKPPAFTQDNMRQRLRPLHH